MSKPIYYRTEGYNSDGSRIIDYPVKKGPFPLPSTGTFGSMTGRISTAANCSEAVQKLKTVQKRDKGKGFPQTFEKPDVPPIDRSCYDNSGIIEINIPVNNIDVQSAGRIRTRGRRRRAVSIRRRQPPSSRRKAKKTRHSRKR